MEKIIEAFIKENNFSKDTKAVLAFYTTHVANAKTAKEKELALEVVAILIERLASKYYER